MSSLSVGNFVDLAPEIVRQRLVIEGYPASAIDAPQIERYLTELSPLLAMKSLNNPVTHKSPQFGWAGWMHWETSGTHFYAWDTPKLFFSVDIYTCKTFDSKIAIEFTQNFFSATKISSKEF